MALLPPLFVGVCAHLQWLRSNNTIVLQLMLIFPSTTLEYPLHLGQPVVLVPCPAHEACVYDCHDVDHQQLVLERHHREVDGLDDGPEGCLSSQGGQEVDLHTQIVQGAWQLVVRTIQSMKADAKQMPLSLRICAQH